MNEGPRILRLPEWTTVSPQKLGTVHRYFTPFKLHFIAVLSADEYLSADVPERWCQQGCADYRWERKVSAQKSVANDWENEGKKWKHC